VFGSGQWSFGSGSLARRRAALGVSIASKIARQQFIVETEMALVDRW